MTCKHTVYKTLRSSGIYIELHCGRDIFSEAGEYGIDDYSKLVIENKPGFKVYYMETHGSVVHKMDITRTVLNQLYSTEDSFLDITVYM